MGVVRCMRETLKSNVVVGECIILSPTVCVWSVLSVDFVPMLCERLVCFSARLNLTLALQTGIKENVNCFSSILFIFFWCSFLL